MKIERIEVEQFRTPNGELYKTAEEARQALLRESLVKFLMEVLKMKEFDRNTNDVWNFVSLALHRVESGEISFERLNLIFAGADVKEILNLEISEPQSSLS